MNQHFRAALLLTTSAVISATAAAGEWQGSVEGEYLWFAQDALFPGQEDSYLSAAVEPEYFHEWNNGYDVFNAKLFYRVDQYDDERTHGDIRELAWLHAASDWEINVGVSKVYWGVMSLIRDWGVVSMFVLPGFRERTFPGVNGRPRFGVPVDTDNAEYESSAEEKHTDLAIRYSHYIGDWEFGIAHFSGTAREPRLKRETPTSTVVVPVYEQINQTSLDVQANIGSWLWKLESYIRSGQGDTYTAAAGGFEYTFVGVFGSQTDIGLISEYLYDEREDTIKKVIIPGEPIILSPFENDLTIGMRLTLNDAQSTELLASIIEDLDGEGRTYNIEASRRFGDSMTLSIEARGVSDVPLDNALSSFNQDNRIRTKLTYFF